MHNHHHGKHHKEHKKHSHDTTYHLDGDKLKVHFLDEFSPEVEGEIDVSHFSKGHGGQNVNKSNKGVHLTFTPEDGGEKILSSCIDERSEIQNREKALRNLIEKIRDKYKLNTPRKESKIPGSQKRRRLEAKRRRSETKQLRERIDL